MSNTIDEKNNLQDASFSNDLINFFDDFLKQGAVVREKEVVPGFTIKLKVLNTEELLLAESILIASNPNIPSDVILKVRAASILSQAILAINELAIERDNLPQTENNSRRQGLYKQILKMPALLIQKTYEFYVSAVKEQNALFETPGKLSETIENF